MAFATVTKYVIYMEIVAKTFKVLVAMPVSTLLVVDLAISAIMVVYNFVAANSPTLNPPADSSTLSISTTTSFVPSNTMMPTRKHSVVEMNSIVIYNWSSTALI